MVRSITVLRWALALLLLSLSSLGAAQAPARVPCQDAAQSELIRDARRALQDNPELLGPRLKLADALVDAGCYAEATSVLEAGQDMHPHSRELLGKLRDVRSMVSEQRYFEGLDQAQENAKLQRNVLRCTQLGDVSACDGALQSKPDDTTILTAKGDALLKANRPAEALAVYRRAASLSPADEPIKAKLTAAQLQRESSMVRCETGSGPTALESCDAALMRGADDEFNIDRRKGILLQSANQPERALDSYIAANVLKQDNQSVALAIVALTESTGRKDALALQARGTALMTLGRPNEAVPVLTQAQALAPTLPAIKSQLDAARAQAQALAQTEPRRPKPSAITASTGTTERPAKSKSAASASNNPPPAATQVASAAPAEARTYSNDAPAAQTN